jgi:hypothetical protein
MASHPQEEQEATWGAITEAIGEHADENGAIRLENLVLMAVGRA